MTDDAAARSPCHPVVVSSGREMRAKVVSGLSLLEFLISLTLFFITLLMGLQFFAASRNQFTKLKQSYESRSDLLAAADKIKADSRTAGQGISIPVSLGIIEPVSSEESGLTIRKLQDGMNLTAALEAGQTFIPLESTSAFSRNRDLCFCGHGYGEIIAIAEVTKTGIRLASPLAQAYRPPESTLLQINEVTFFLDGTSHILRRCVNRGSAQPLLEDVRDFHHAYEAEHHLIRVRLVHSPAKEEEYETWIFPRNTALALSRNHDRQE